MDTEEIDKIDINGLKDAIVSLEKHAARSKIEGIIYLMLTLIIASTVVFYFGTFAASQRNVTVNAGTADSINIDQKSGWEDMVGEGILRIGAVLLAIFLIQILVSFSRYKFRISEISYSRSLALKLGGANPNSVGFFANHFSLELIDFGKLPKNPYEKIFGLLEKIASKIPSGAN